MANEEVAGDDPRRQKGQHVPQQAHAAHLKVAESDDDAAHQSDGTAADGGGFELAFQDDSFQRQGEQGLQADQDGGAGDGGKAQGLEPHHIVQRQKQASRDNFSPLSSAQPSHLCSRFLPEQQEWEQRKGCQEEAVKGGDARGGVGQLDEDGRGG